MTTTYTDAQGNQVPARYIKAYDKKRDAIARKIFARWLKAHDTLARVKAETLSDIEALQALAEKEAGISLGGAKGNLQFRSFDGSITISLDQQPKTEFDERLKLAQTLIMEAIRERAEGLDGDLQDLVEIATKAFTPRKSGRLDMQRVRDLRNYKVRHPKWAQACKIISECERQIGSKAYLRVIHREGVSHTPRNIPLDIAAID
ncbi:MAG TPA: DUF3164 family protein [Kiritimatiellia bacterium]|nr:DUF3164 family protein [Kiritimatiellia bacterium]